MQVPKPKRRESVSSLKKKADKVFSEWVRRSNADWKGVCVCISCGRRFHWGAIQAGHFVPRHYQSLRYSPENVFPQCPGCNIFKRGNYDEFSLALVRKFGKKHLEKLNKLKWQEKRWTPQELKDLIQTYQANLTQLC